MAKEQICIECGEDINKCNCEDLENYEPTYNDDGVEYE